LVPYLVTGSGRAYCGDTLGPLREGEEVVGTMWLTDTTDETWTVESVVPSTGDISTKSASLGEGKTLDAAYLTLETMVIYGCDAYPESGSVVFGQNFAADRSQAEVTSPKWISEVKHAECAQETTIDNSAQTVELKWDPTIVL